MTGLAVRLGASALVAAALAGCPLTVEDDYIIDPEAGAGGTDSAPAAATTKPACRDAGEAACGHCRGACPAGSACEHNGDCASGQCSSGECRADERDGDG